MLVFNLVLRLLLLVVVGTTPGGDNYIIAMTGGNVAGSPASGEVQSVSITHTLNFHATGTENSLLADQFVAPITSSAQYSDLTDVPDGWQPDDRGWSPIPGVANTSIGGGAGQLYGYDCTAILNATFINPQNSWGGDLHMATSVVAPALLRLGASISSVASSTAHALVPILHVVPNLADTYLNGSGVSGFPH